MQILLIEDDKAIRETLYLYMCDAAQNRHCDTARNVPEAIRMISKKHYDLIMLDLLLEGELGIPVIEHVRATWPNNTPAICVISAMHGADKIAAQNNVNYYLPKPFTLDMLDEIALQKKCS